MSRNSNKDFGTPFHFGGKSMSGINNSSGYCFTPTDDQLEEQMIQLELAKKRRHEQWVQAQQAQTKFDPKNNFARAQILIAEAYRLEKMHLSHQYEYAKKLVRKHRSDSSSPPRILCESNKAHSCSCLQAPVFRQLTPKYRAMNLLLPHFEDIDLEKAVETIQGTYRNDTEMMEDLVYRYGPEPKAVDPKLWLASIEERRRNLKSKWRGISDSVAEELKLSDNFHAVIRNFSVMRIFLEGAQAPTYSCDSSDRARRDAVHRQVLSELEANGTLFLTSHSTPKRK